MRSRIMRRTEGYARIIKTTRLTRGCLFYPSRQVWYIITRQRVYHQHGIAVLYLITPLGVYQKHFRNDDMQRLAPLMIYKTSF